MVYYSCLYIIYVDVKRDLEFIISRSKISCINPLVLLDLASLDIWNEAFLFSMSKKIGKLP